MRVLIADDDRLFAEYLTALVVDCGHEVIATVTGGGLATLQSYARHRPDVALLDVIMPRYNGFTVCQQLVSRDPAARIILMSGLVASDYPSLASSPACGYLTKPLVMDELRAALAQADFSRKLWPMASDPTLPSPIFTKAQEETWVDRFPPSLPRESAGEAA